VRQDAAEALGQIGDAQALAGLVQGLRSEHQEVRCTAKRALVQVGSPAVDPLLSIMNDDNAVVREAIARVLGEIGDRRAVSPLISSLRDNSVHVRKNAAHALGRIGDAQAVKPLLAAIEDSDPRVRQAAAEALGLIGDLQAVVMLAAATEDSDSKVRQTSAKALGQLGDSRAAARLIALLKDSSPNLRQAAAEGLGDIGDPDAVRSLVQGLEDKSADVRCAAAEALGRIDYTRPLEPSPIQHRDPLIAAIAAQRRRPDVRALEALDGALEDDKERVRRASAVALGIMGDERGVDWLVTALHNAREVDASHELIQALAKTCHTKAVGALISTLHTGKRWERRPAAEVLVALYHQKGLDEHSKREILAQRETITFHHDARWHRDEQVLHSDQRRGYNVSDCVHSDGERHKDEGIAVDFPI
jgi:HEAT repeat protein